MARNPPKSYGKSMRVWDDADATFSTTRGLPVVVQAAYHRMTNEVVLGPGGDEFGVDVTKWAGMDVAKFARRAPIIAEAIQRDSRIDTCDVRITPTKIAGTLWSVSIAVSCTTALGPFRRVFSLQQKTTDEAVLILQGDS